VDIPPVIRSTGEVYRLLAEFAQRALEMRYDLLVAMDASLAGELWTGVCLSIILVCIDILGLRLAFQVINADANQAECQDKVGDEF
jgi:hypothetical protein